MKRILLIAWALAMLMGVTTAYAVDQQATDEQMSYASGQGSTGDTTYFHAPQFEYPPSR
ncbi:MAG TPA: hypothetical protein VLX44_07635 [Xanthobacteraceae bacterium]|nr:hypothetical protein [Xanthobacteraceae bacterium]